MSKKYKSYKRSKKHGENISKAKRGKRTSIKTEFKKGRIRTGIDHPFYGKHHTLKTKRKLALYTGKKSSNWKGGLDPLSKLVRQCFKYRQWRSDIFTRDDFTCQNCGIKGVFLEAHHIESFSKIFYRNKIKTRKQAILCEELWNINNGLTLCEKCHKKTDTYKKRNDII